MTNNKNVNNMSDCPYAADTREQAFQDGMAILNRDEKRAKFMPGWPQHRIWSDKASRDAESRAARASLQLRLTAYWEAKAQKALAEGYSLCMDCSGKPLSCRQSCGLCSGKGFYKPQAIQTDAYRDCEYCYGSGMSYGQSCHACGGNGWYKRSNH